MTTVAWDGKSIAADRQLGHRMEVGKLFRLKSGGILGGAGWYSQIVEVVAWLNEGAKPADKPKFPDAEESGSDFLLIEPDGSPYWLTWPFLRRVKINETYSAIGSGCEYALGAMANGASAKRAVEIACKFDPSTGKGVNVIRVKK